MQHKSPHSSENPEARGVRICSWFLERRSFSGISHSTVSEQLSWRRYFYVTRVLRGALHKDRKIVKKKIPTNEIAARETQV